MRTYDKGFIKLLIIDSFRSPQRASRRSA